MVSIPHYEDLSAQAIYDSLELMWWPSEKLDGSYLLFGLDDQGQFFSQRKGGEPCYTVDDWPDECWSTTYRIGHTIAGMVVEGLAKEGQLVAGNKIGAELIHGSMPNSVPYVFNGEFDGLLVITALNFDVNNDFQVMFNDWQCHFFQEIRESRDGLIGKKIVDEHIWRVKINPQMPRELVKARLAPHAKKFKRVLDHWFPQESKVQGFTILEVLDINLAKKHPKCGNRNWNELRKLLATERAELKEVFQAMTLLFKDVACRVLVHEQPSAIGAGSHKEGVVVSTPQGLFKIVDRQAFTEVNRFTHIVKYWIVGGRRPARPSFLSRTKDWPKEERLKRLEVLLNRYKDNHYTMHYTFENAGRSELISYSGQLHSRTLGMFCDTRKRIEDGR